jgi:hypothetical protein
MEEAKRNVARRLVVADGGASVMRVLGATPVLY